MTNLTPVQEAQVRLATADHKSGVPYEELVRMYPHAALREMKRRLEL